MQRVIYLSLFFNNLNFPWSGWAKPWSIQGVQMIKTWNGCLVLLCCELCLSKEVKMDYLNIQISPLVYRTCVVSSNLSASLQGLKTCLWKNYSNCFVFNASFFFFKGYEVCGAACCFTLKLFTGSSVIIVSDLTVTRSEEKPHASLQFRRARSESSVFLRHRKEDSALFSRVDYRADTAETRLR